MAERTGGEPGAAGEGATESHADNLDLQARLHEEIAATISDAVTAQRRRAELLRRLADAKQHESQIVAHDADRKRLKFEAGLSEREAHIVETEVQTMLAEQTRSLAQASTARAKRATESGEAFTKPGT
jgi:hypothetical protein